MNPPSNVPVLVGAVPLLAVTQFTVDEGYRTTAIPGSALVQMVGPTQKTIRIEALLVGPEQALRPALETMALTSRTLAAPVGAIEAAAGIPVVSKSGVHLDMQITNLGFVQDNHSREAVRVTITLVHVPRAKLAGLFGGAADMLLGAGAALI